jgi:hypothetical protein
LLPQQETRFMSQFRGLKWKATCLAPPEGRAIQAATITVLVLAKLKKSTTELSKIALKRSGRRQNAEDRDFPELHPLEDLQWSRRIKNPGWETTGKPIDSSREHRF